MVERKPVVATKVNRQNLVDNARKNFYANLTQVKKENATAPVLEAAPSKTKPLPAKPQTGTFSRAGAEMTRKERAEAATKPQARTIRQRSKPKSSMNMNADLTNTQSQSTNNLRNRAGS